jgi:hypothetical protein
MGVTTGGVGGVGGVGSTGVLSVFLQEDSISTAAVMDRNRFIIMYNLRL